MKKAKSHEIDDKGKRLLREQLPSTWVVNEQFVDYGKDFLVETADDKGNLSGDSFHIQLKSCESHSYGRDKKFVSKEVKSYHARYFAKVQDLPVFLVAMDVNRCVGVYLFMQEWLASNKQYQNQSSISVLIPETNLLSNKDAFYAEVSRAKEWLRARYPTSLQNAIQAELSRMEVIDPRFHVETSISSGRVHHKLQPSTPVHGTLYVSNGKPEALDKLRKFQEFGESVTFAPGEYRLEGSDLFNQSQSSLSLEINPVPAKLQIAGVIDGESISLSFDSVVTGGELKVLVETIEQKCPLKLNLEIEPSQFRLSLSFKAEEWEGVPISRLPFFAKCISFAQNLHSLDKMAISIEKDGVEALRLPCPNLVDTISIAITNFVKDVDRVRKFCSLHKIDPKWSVNHFLREYADFCRVEQLTINGRWSGECKSCTTKGHLTNEEAKRIKLAGLKPSPLVVDSTVEFNFLGVRIPLGRLRYAFSQMSLSKCRKRRNSDLYDIELTATSETILTIEKCTD